MKQFDFPKIFRALSDKQRFKIFLSIHKECCPVAGGIEKAFTKACNCMELSRSTIYHHFKKLYNAGLISCEKKGRVVSCRANREVLKAVRDLLK